MSPTHLHAAAAALVAVGIATAAAPAALAADDRPGGVTRFSSCPELTLVAEVGTYTFSMCFSTVITPNGDGHARFSGRLAPGSEAPPRTVTLTGFSCLAGYPVSFEPATSSRVHITPQGRVNGTCRS